MPLLAGDKPGGDNWSLLARKTGDQTINNSAALTADSALFAAVAASQIYKVELHIAYNSGATPGFQVDFQAPSGATLTNWSLLARAGGVTTLVTATAAGGSTGIQGTGADQVLDIWGLLVTSTFSGTLQFRWAQNTANASNTIVRAGSYLLLQQL